MAVKVMIADDHSLIREGLKQLLELEGDFQVIAEACDGIDCMEKLKEQIPDVLLLDINMPRMNGQQPYQVNMPQMNGGQTENPHRVQQADDAHVHVMPDGMTCMPNKAFKVSDVEGKTEVSRAEVLRNAFVFSELISEPVCKKRHRNRRR